MTDVLSRPVTRLLLSVVLLTAACSAPSRSVRYGDRLLPKEGPCAPRVFGDHERPKSFLVVGRVDAQSPSQKGQLRGMLEQQACRLGADGLIDVSIDSLSTVRSTFDQQTRDTRIDRGPLLHVASALAVLVQDATVVKTVPASCPVCEEKVCPEQKPCPPPRLCAPCPACPARDVAVPVPTEAKPAEAKGPEAKGKASGAAKTPAPAPEVKPEFDPLLGELPPLEEE